MVNFRQVKSNEWIKDDYRPFAEISIMTSKIAEKFGVVFVNSFESGLGESKLGAFITHRGTQFFLEEFLPNQERFITQVGLLNNIETLPNNLDEVLEVLELTSKKLTWYDENIKFHPHELWRQDDHGHRFLIETFPCRADAIKAMKEFEARLHKQTYWVKKVEPPIM
jgi:hypothetical protein